MKPYLVILLCCISSICIAQEYVYVNTDSLLLRSRPEKVYLVYSVLHAPCRLKLEPYSRSYEHDQAIKSKFYHVNVVFKGEKDKIHTQYGWVEKEYVVGSKSEVTVPWADTSINISLRDIYSLPHIGTAEHDPNKTNCRKFPFPKYKGGEKQFPELVKRVYHQGPRGGCYYIGAKGQKKYVDAKLCR